MNLYLIDQNFNTNYDTYDSAVVIAENEDQARLIHPSYYVESLDQWWEYGYGSWAKSPDQVTVTYLGVYEGEPVKSPIICASFNAG